MDKVKDYLAQLSSKEKKTYEIAKKQLGSSFHITKSIGYINYLKKNP